MEKLNVHVIKPGGDALENADKFVILKKNFLRYTNPSHQTIFVCSAVKNCTRILVDLFEAKKARNESRIERKLWDLRELHIDILKRFFPDEHHPIWTEYFTYILQLNRYLKSIIIDSDEVSYGYILKFGELISSKILSAFLNDNGVPNKWIDTRDYIKTTSANPAQIVEGVSEKLLQNVKPIFKINNVLVGEGFIGSDYHSGKDAVMAFDSSDTSAAFFGHALNAKSVILLKKIKGIVKSDDQINNPDAEILGEMTYGDAYSRFRDSSIYPLHPDSIEIASRKGIPLYLKSYEDWSYPGTLIHG